MEIRSRAEHDLAAVAELVSKVRSSDGYPMFLPGDDAARFLTRPEPTAAWVAVDDRRLRGHVALNATTSAAAMELVQEQDGGAPPLYIAWLLVDPDHRRRRIGRELLRHAEQAALDLGCSPHLDVVVVPATLPAVALYREQGWVELGRVDFAPIPGAIEIVFRSGCSR